jgi:hypothetical protein
MNETVDRDLNREYSVRNVTLLTGEADMEKQYTVTLTERQIRDLETYALSQELNSSHRSNVEFYNELFTLLNEARNKKEA